ncbi:MAG: Lipid A export ATP-binding/permease protein MsbA [Alphaproteobacteria bacterium MarineAlpha7_Bin1]|nr:MAG: Lipid A export ATP-binding/permease protein MsbA [Alphaproteobacteria bacterium MarineAlpha7_Bin1]
MEEINKIQKSKTLPLVKRLFNDYVRSYKFYIAMAVICMVFAAATTAANAWIMQPVLDDVFLDKNKDMLMILPIAVLIIAIVKGFSEFGQSVLMLLVGQRTIADIQKDMYASLMKADLSFFHNNPSGNLVARFISDVNRLRHSVTTALTGIAKDTLTLIFLVALMFYRDWELASIAFLIFPLAIYPITRIGRMMRKISAATQNKIGEFSTLLNQTFQGSRQVKAYGMEGYEGERARDYIDEITRLIFKSSRRSTILRPIMETLGGIAVAGVVLYGGIKVIDGETTPGTFFSFLTAFFLAYRPLKSLAGLNAVLQDGLASAERLFRILDIEPKIQDRNNSKTIENVKGTIEFKNVEFAYENKDYILKKISLLIPRGKKIALVGPSGAGKSTILNLIPRFFEVEKGQVEIDGIDIKEIKIGSLRSSMALVSQEINLFDDTIRSNIAYGKLDSSEEEIIAAAKKSASHDFITKLPNSYNTTVGEHGVKLSGGQRQRIAIARAMLKNAPILLLDEATSSLDTESERYVQEALLELMKNRTTLVIAHRLSTVINADTIYVIDSGKIAESGTHLELLKNEGVYSRLYTQQFAEQEKND